MRAGFFVIRDLELRIVEGPEVVAQPPKYCFSADS